MQMRKDGVSEQTIFKTFKELKQSSYTIGRRRNSMSFKQIEELEPLLARIDSLQERIDIAKAAEPDAYDRVMDSWAIESTYNSNNIEGSTLSLGDTALLYDGVQVDGPIDDIRQAEGGFAALRFLRKAVEGGDGFSEGLIKRAHELAYAEAKDPKTRGRYRDVEVEITGTDFQPAPAAYVPERMSELVASCAKTKRHPVITAALFHLEFESIHPFVNANGRTGRLMSNFLLMKSGFEPINIQAESRARYIAAIRAFQEQDDPYPFVAFFYINLAERLEKVLGLLSKGVEPAESWEVSEIGSYLETEENIPKYQRDTLDDTLEHAVLALLREDPSISQAEIADKVGKSLPTVKRAMKRLSEADVIRRVGGKRFGKKAKMKLPF